MFVLVTYDVNTQTKEGRRRLRRVAKACEDCGQRVQNSVFECVVDPAKWQDTRRTLESEIDPGLDSLRYYFLGSKWKRKVQHVGAKPSYDPEGLLLV